MASNHRGINLNDPGDPAPWSPQEKSALQLIIDAICLNTPDGNLSNYKTIGHAHDTLIDSTNTVRAQVNSIGAIEIINLLRVNTMTTEGVVKNTSAGYLSGGNTLEVDDVDAPWLLSGFEDASDTTMSFVNGTRTFAISPVATDYVVWADNNKYTKTVSNNVVLPDVEGLYVIYFDSGGVLNYTTSFTSTLFSTTALVASIYWDATNSKELFFGDERHGAYMSPATHEYLHQTVGCAYQDGLGLGNIDTDQSGASDSHAQFSIGNGNLWDEDIQFAITDDDPQNISPILNAPIYYREGTDNWRKDDADAFPVKNFVGGSGLLAYNENVGGTWQQTEVSTAQFVLCHIFGTNEVDHPIVSIQGQETYASQNAARLGAETEILNLTLSNLPSKEMKALYTVIYQTSTGYSNTPKARTRTTDLGDDFIDWRFYTTGVLSSGSGTSDHGSLGGLTDDDHSQYLLLAGRSGGQTMTGGTGSGDDLVFRTTTNATKGSYVFDEFNASGFIKTNASGVITGGNTIDLSSDVISVLPIANGGTGSSAKTQAFDNLSPCTTKGDIIGYNGSDNIRLPVGNNGESLVADSTESAGVKWANLSSIGLTYIYTAESGTTPPPTAGYIKWNSGTQASATKLYINDTDTSGNNIENLLLNLSYADRIHLQSKIDPANFQLWNITAVTNQTAYVEFDISLVTSAGAVFGADAEMYVTFMGADSSLIDLQKAYDNSASAPEISGNLELDGDLKVYDNLAVGKTGAPGYPLDVNGQIKHLGEISTVTTYAPSGTSGSWDVSTTSDQLEFFLQNTTGDFTLTISNAEQGGKYQISCKQRNTTPRLLTLAMTGFTLKYPNGGQDYLITNTASAEDVITISVLKSNVAYVTIVNNFGEKPV
jgi:hypothetical protein